MDDPFARPVVLSLPGMESVAVTKNLTARTGRAIDVYRPPEAAAGELRPAVVFVPGDAPEEVIAGAKDWGQYVSWGRLAAVSGLVGVTVNHRSTNGFSECAGAADDVDAAIELVRERGPELGIDAERIAIWTCSAGAPFALRTALRDRPPHIWALVALYSVMDLRPDREMFPATISDETLAEFSCLRHLEAGGTFPPLLLARAGKDRESLNRSIEAFVAAAISVGIEVDYLNHADGQHAFDVRDDDFRSRAIVSHVLAFLRSTLLD